MHSRRVWGLAMPLAGLLAAGVVATPASADVTQQFNCTATVAQLSALGASLPIGSYVSNAGNTVCADAQNPIGSGGATISLAPLGLGTSVTIGAGGSTTTQVADDTQMAVNSVASLSGVTVPTPAGNITIPGPAQATATLSCVNNQVQSTVGSTLSSLNVAGQQINLPTAGATQTIPLTVAGLPIGSVTVNPSSVTSTGATQALLDVNLLNAGHVVLGQATASTPTGNPCVDIPSVLPPGQTGPTGPSGGTGSTGPSGSNGTTGSNGSNGSKGSNGSNGSNGVTTITAACPVGTVRLSSGMCALGTTANPTSTIVEAANSHDIVGGQVISLAQARKLYRGATCLNGAGPKFVVVGTKRNDNIRVSKIKLRVLGLAGNDRITVSGGSGTCVNGGAGADTIRNMQRNRVKLYGANGNDHITVGNGPALLSGGNGNDVLVAGLGRDVISGGTGNNTLTAHGPVAYVSAGAGKTVASVRKHNQAYARKHGVKTIKVLAK